VLIRHGESEATVNQVVGGHSGCTGLSPLGRKQVEALRERLDASGELADAAALYASVMPRAVETAEILAPALGDLSVVQECGVCEIHPGEADGLTWQEFTDRFGTPTRDPFLPWAPGAESWAMFASRVGTALRDLTRRHADQLVVVACHAGVVDLSFVVFGRLPLELPFDRYVENTSLTEWQVPDGGRSRLVRFNDAAHLAGLA
jgi:probable phosphoglycerate mutase